MTAAAPQSSFRYRQRRDPVPFAPRLLHHGSGPIDRFGADHVFMDIKRHPHRGDFEDEALQQALDRCDGSRIDGENTGVNALGRGEGRTPAASSLRETTLSTRVEGRIRAPRASCA